MKTKKPSASMSDRPTQTTLSASSNTLPEAQLLSQEFQKLAGTLPETIAPSDLDTLNSALRYLFIFLREASRQFHEEGDDGRSAAFYALTAYWMFVTAFQPALSENLQLPILNLQEALANTNAVAPIFKPTPRRGRSPSSVKRAVMRGHAAATVTILKEIGFGRDEALTEVAKVLAQIGIRPERGTGVLKAGTVRSWCNEVSSDVGRHGEAARQYDLWIKKYDLWIKEPKKNSEKSKKARGRHWLAVLAKWVRSVFPQRKKLPNPPFS
jgi:hypothetical protein